MPKDAPAVGCDFLREKGLERYSKINLLDRTLRSRIYGSVMYKLKKH